jgi:hypothetical protein
MEARLKVDVLTEAALFDNHILVTEEDDDMQVCVQARMAARTLAVGLGGTQARGRFRPLLAQLHGMLVKAVIAFAVDRRACAPRSGCYQRAVSK